jgi:hypothetical protein
VLYRSGPGKPWKARPDDKLPFLVTTPQPRGPENVVASNHRERKLASAYLSALRKWRAGEKGAEAALKRFEGKTIGGHQLITDRHLLIELEDAGRPGLLLPLPFRRRRVMKPHGKSNRIGCAICGSRQNVQWHHIGGKKHLAWVMMPVCQPHHRQCHALITRARINLEYTSDPVERLIRASIAISIFRYL